MLKQRQSLAVLLLLLVGGCDSIEGLFSRLVDDPTRVVRVTTTGGQSVVLMQPALDYLHEIGAGRYDRAAFVEGRGLRTTDGILDWSDFTALTIRRSGRTAKEAMGGGEIVHQAEVQLRNGTTVAKALRDTPTRGVLGWRKAGDLPSTSGYVWVEIPLGMVARIEKLESARERVPDRQYKTFRITARHREHGTCEGIARLHHPLPVQSNVHVSHDDGALGFRVEEQGILLEMDLQDIREVAVGEPKGEKAVTRFTFNSGEKRAYPTRNAYFDMQTPNIACKRVSLFELRSIVISERL